MVFRLLLTVWLTGRACGVGWVDQGGVKGRVGGGWIQEDSRRNGSVIQDGVKKGFGGWVAPGGSGKGCVWEGGWVCGWVQDKVLHPL